MKDTDDFKIPYGSGREERAPVTWTDIHKRGKSLAHKKKGKKRKGKGDPPLYDWEDERTLDLKTPLVREHATDNDDFTPGMKTLKRPYPWEDPDDVPPLHRQEAKSLH